MGRQAEEPHWWVVLPALQIILGILAKPGTNGSSDNEMWEGMSPCVAPELESELQAAPWACSFPKTPGAFCLLGDLPGHEVCSMAGPLPYSFISQ